MLVLGQRAGAEEFVRNLQPYPEREKRRFWKRLRRLGRLRRRANPFAGPEKAEERPLA